RHTSSTRDWSSDVCSSDLEIYYVDKAEDMVRAGDLNPRYFQNPTLLTYFVAAELLGTRLLGPLAGPLTPDVPGSANLLARLDSRSEAQRVGKRRGLYHEPE